jgi:steroid delta-isomerase-like uncharacterized protein
MTQISNKVLAGIVVAAIVAAVAPSVWAAGSSSAKDSNASGTAMMKIYDSFNSGDVTGLDKLVSASFVDHQPIPGVTASGLDGLKQTISMMRAAFPDLHMKVEDTISSGDRVVCRCNITGTQKGEWMGAPPSGKAFSIDCIDIVRFENGKAVEHWGESDDLGMMQQLGAMPAKSAWPTK